MAPPLVWCITGTTLAQFIIIHAFLIETCSHRSGLGRDLALKALNRGEKVIATGRARSIEKLQDLKKKGADILELDVTASLDTLHKVAKEAIAIHGRVDVLVNNAGLSGHPDFY